MAHLSNPLSRFSDWSRGGHVIRDGPTRARGFLENVKRKPLSAFLVLGSVASLGLGVISEK